MVDALASVRDALGDATAKLADTGCDTPRLDAELLLAAALGVSRTELFLRPGSAVDGPALECFDSFVARRAAREPVAYLLGVKPFRRLEVPVDPRVLIPRPETELLVEVGLELQRGARVLDVGCGSGAVALALKDERDDLCVWGSDFSADAVDVARANARQLGIDANFVVGDLLAAPGPWDAVLANLPYVVDGMDLAPEIALYEPPRALFGGGDGLDLIRRLVAMLGAIPTVALEVGTGQAAEVSELLRGAGFESVQRRHDLAGHERVVAGRR